MRIVLPFLMWLACSSGLASQTNEIQFSQADWETTKKEASEAGKLIFIDGYATWCLPCKQMEASVYKMDEVAQYYNTHFINYKLDMEQELGALFAVRYQVQSYPAYLFITPDETLVFHNNGAMTQAKFIEMGTLANEPLRIDEARITRYQEGDRKPDFIFAYVQQMKASGNGDYRQIADDYLRESYFHSPYDYQLILELANQLDDRWTQYLIEHKLDAGQYLSASTIRDHLLDLADASLQETKNAKGDLTAAKRAVANQIYPEYPGKSTYYFERDQSIRQGKFDNLARQTMAQLQNKKGVTNAMVIDALHLYRDQVNDLSAIMTLLAWTKKWKPEAPDMAFYQAGYELAQKSSQRKYIKWFGKKIKN